MPCAVSGRRYATASSSSTGPRNVLNIRLNCLGSVNSAPPQFGQSTTPSALALEVVVRGSAAGSSCTRRAGRGTSRRDRTASHTRGRMMIAASTPTTSSRSWHRSTATRRCGCCAGARPRADRSPTRNAAPRRSRPTGTRCPRRFARLVTASMRSVIGAGLPSPGRWRRPLAWRSSYRCSARGPTPQRERHELGEPFQASSTAPKRR